MGDPETSRSGSHTRLRIGAWIASLALVGLFAAILAVTSKTLLRDAPPAIRAYVEAQLHPPPAARARAAQMRRGAGAPMPAQAPASSDASALANALICFSHDWDRRRVARCPEDARPQWDTNARRPGEPPHESRLPAYDFGELVLRNPVRCETAVGAPIVKICQSLYRDPPPPSRTAEEICEAGGIGPCHPPPFIEPTRTQPY